MALSRKIVGALAIASVLATVVPLSVADAAVTHPRPDQLRAGLVGDAQQVLVVSSTRWSATSASASLYERRGTTWVRIAGPYTARVGRKGTSPDHIEGDGTTPAGSHRMISAFGLRTKSPTKLAYRTVTRGDCWISDIEDDDYNSWVQQVPCGSKNENLWSIARRGPYANAIVTDYNMSPVIVPLGSAMFVHVHSRSKSGATVATSGCISVTSAQLVKLLGKLDPAQQPRVVVGPASWLRGATT